MILVQVGPGQQYFLDLFKAGWHLLCARRELV